MHVIRISDRIGSPFAVAVDDGQSLFHEVVALIEANENVTLSFEGVRLLTSAFLNAAIGQLYGRPDPEHVAARLKLVDLSPEDAAVIERVARVAREYYADRDRFKRATILEPA